MGTWQVISILMMPAAGLIFGFAALYYVSRHDLN